MSLWPKFLLYITIDNATNNNLISGLLLSFRTMSSSSSLAFQRLDYDSEDDDELQLFEFEFELHHGTSAFVPSAQRFTQCPQTGRSRHIPSTQQRNAPRATLLMDDDDDELASKDLTRARLSSTYLTLTQSSRGHAKLVRRIHNFSRTLSYLLNHISLKSDLCPSLSSAHYHSLQP